MAIKTITGTLRLRPVLTSSKLGGISREPQRPLATINLGLNLRSMLSVLYFAANRSFFSVFSLFYYLRMPLARYPIIMKLLLERQQQATLRNVSLRRFWVPAVGKAESFRSVDVAQEVFIQRPGLWKSDKRPAFQALPIFRADSEIEIPTENK